MKNILTALLLLATITASAQLPTYVPTANLVTYYAFDNVDSTNDLSGNGNNGARYGNVQHDSDKCGIADGAYLFNYPQKGIVRTAVDTSNFHQFSLGQTISFWVNVPFPVPVDGQRHIMVQYGSTIVSLYYAGIVYENGYDSVVGGGYGWQNFTVTVSDSVRIYHNGVKTVTKVTTAPASALDTFTDGNLYIGGHLTNTDTTNLFYGNIDNVAIYNRAITDAEVLALNYTCPTLAVNTVVSAKNKIYPSPANNSLTIEGNTGDVYYMADVTGKVIKTLKTGTTDISDIANGMYIVTDRMTVNQKIIVAH